jgi:hypothetical protein
MSLNILFNLKIHIEKPKKLKLETTFAFLTASQIMDSFIF